MFELVDVSSASPQRAVAVAEAAAVGGVFLIGIIRPRYPLRVVISLTLSVHGSYSA